ncbi:hypothetical protein [Streptomyces virginiae]|uniref:hypothetical protein n=1 Tax=Streptomyces virginiae TaxID=1961 RepID=UPI002250596C|nr:hypothetical protein [Streptomyces virginiae]MCX4960026.1 hypothetical protein [Streptomyces virginiae]
MEQSSGCDAEPATGHADLMSLVARATGAGTGEPVVAVPVVTCRLCGSDGEFEVWAGDCYCRGCLIAIGVWDGSEPEAFPLTAHAFPWKLVPSAAPLPSLPSSDYFRCSAGDMLFQVAVAVVLGQDGVVRRLSVGLRCSEHGGLYLYIDNARVEPIESREASSGSRR